jgi:hypothetical protein
MHCPCLQEAYSLVEEESEILGVPMLSLNFVKAFIFVLGGCYIITFITVIPMTH